MTAAPLNPYFRDSWTFEPLLSWQQHLQTHTVVMATPLNPYFHDGRTNTFHWLHPNFCEGHTFKLLLSWQLHLYWPHHWTPTFVAATPLISIGHTPTFVTATALNPSFCDGCTFEPLLLWWLYLQTATFLWPHNIRGVAKWKYGCAATKVGLKLVESRGEAEGKG